MNLVFSALLFLFSPIAPEHDAVVTQEAKFFLPLGYPEEERAKYVSYRLWVSADRGSTWKHHGTIDDQGKGFHFEAFKHGTYWFILQTVSKDAKVIPPTVANSKRADLKVFVNVERRIMIREIVDLQTLTAQLRSRVSALRKNLVID
jgi:hypothetical protein